MKENLKKSLLKMINFDDVTGENVKAQNENWSQVPY